MKEIWKKICDSNGYEISNKGRLRNKNNLIIKPTICKNGYLEYALWKNGKRKVILAHRLVAKYFIDNPNDYPEVNHKDENIQNNNVNNLEWCTSEQNANYGTRNERCRNANKYKFIKIQQYDLYENLLNTFECIEDAARYVNGDSSHISRSARNNRIAYGYKWIIIN